MAKIHKIVCYIVDANNDFETAQENIDYINSRLKFGGNIDPVEMETESFVWDDDLAINKCGCTKEEYEKYFKKER